QAAGGRRRATPEWKRFREGEEEQSARRSSGNRNRVVDLLRSLESAHCCRLFKNHPLKDATTESNAAAECRLQAGGPSRVDEVLSQVQLPEKRQARRGGQSTGALVGDLVAHQHQGGEVGQRGGAGQDRCCIVLQAEITEVEAAQLPEDGRPGQGPDA